MYTFKNIYSLLPLLGIGLNSYGLWQKKLKITRRCELISAVLVTIYNIIIRSYTGALTTGIEGVLTIFAIINYDILKKKKI
ncbi:MAG: YgjV family protein [Bacilli bacterium]|nr:YgjV family protein [Bacilli bacterium]